MLALSKLRISLWYRTCKRSHSRISWVQCTSSDCTFSCACISVSHSIVRKNSTNSFGSVELFPRIRHSLYARCVAEVFVAQVLHATPL